VHSRAVISAFPAIIVIFIFGLLVAGGGLIFLWAGLVRSSATVLRLAQMASLAGLALCVTVCVISAYIVVDGVRYADLHAGLPNYFGGCLGAFLVSAVVGVGMLLTLRAAANVLAR